MFLEIKDSDALHAEMKRLCRFLADNQVSETAVFNSRLVITELAGNALKHAKSTASVRVETEEDCIVIYESSSKPFTPPKQSSCSGVVSESGRGLYLVDSVCVQRSVATDGAIKVILKK